MLTYTSLLVACLVVSAVVYFIYKVVSDSSRSVYRSRTPMAILDAADRQKNPGRDSSLAGNGKAFGQNRGHTTPKNFARTYPAMPTETVNWRWEGAGVQLREPQLHSGNNTGNSSHCSLYDVNTPQPVSAPNSYIGRLHREEQSRPTGRTYKVTRKSQRPSGDDGDLSKPWGW